MGIIKKIGLAAFCLFFALPGYAVRCPAILMSAPQYASLSGETFAVVYVNKNQIQILKQTENGDVVGDEIPIVDGTPDEEALQFVREDLASIPENRIFSYAVEGTEGIKGLNLNFQSVPASTESANGENAWPRSLVNVASDYIVREKMKEYAAGLQKMFQEIQEFESAHDDLQPIFGPHLVQISFRSRAKELSSIEHKLQRKALEKNLPILSLQHARNMIGDGVGFRVVIKTPGESSHKTIDDLTDVIAQNLANRIESGLIQVSEIHNYHAPGAKAYLNAEQVLRLVQASDKTGKPIDVDIKHGSAFKESGYTSLNLNIVLPSGVSAELQIRGEIVDRLAEIEHIYYNFRSKKIMSMSENQSLNEFMKALNQLDSHQQIELNQYLTNYYIYARALETEGPETKTPPQRPPLPAGLPSILSLENAARLQGLSF